VNPGFEMDALIMFAKLNRSVPSLMAAVMLSAAVAPAMLAVPTVASAQAISVEKKADETFLGLRKFLQLPQGERDKITLVYYLKLKAGNYSQVSITLTEAGKSQPLSITPDGRIQPLPSLAQMNNGAVIKVKGPDGLSPALRLKVVSTLPTGTQYDAGALRAGLEQSNQVTKKVAGAMAAFLPKLDNVFFLGATSGTAIMADGSQRPLPMSPATWLFPQGAPVYVPSAMPNVQAIRLNSAPSRVVYGEAVK
jgi:hypothetical protein